MGQPPGVPKGWHSHLARVESSCWERPPMLSAQINGRAGTPMGMNYPGTENRQFALNIMHWLSGMKFPTYTGVIAAKPKPALPAKKSSVASASPPPGEPAENAESVAMPAAEIAAPIRAETGRVALIG